MKKTGITDQATTHSTRSILQQVKRDTNPKRSLTARRQKTTVSLELNHLQLEVDIPPTLQFDLELKPVQLEVDIGGGNHIDHTHLKRTKPRQPIAVVRLLGRAQA
ncbi:hypothetical protein PGT21_001417 [Puccinia graminis f. sp. tritici]|uniref:Uncharacterized protein n=1 Tax=Puccinia graminis f. sp. tritici TaxID=56615 RepID=A0A5B0SGB4_PUCGR|nr:hypothetical protein PGT21_001417 [Puccinia graminis f. sp. tritici]KAA1136892.1 hypothetical protein PGTUg99_002332 [Puccinia graminis f. sp. tritici]